MEGDRKWSIGFDFSGIVHVKVKFVMRKKKIDLSKNKFDKFYLFVVQHLIDFRN